MGYSIPGDLSQVQGNNRTATTNDLSKGVSGALKNYHGGDVVYTDANSGKTYQLSKDAGFDPFAVDSFGNTLVNLKMHNLSQHGQGNENIRNNSTELTNYKQYDELADAINAVASSNGALTFGTNRLGGYYTYDTPNYQATSTTTTQQGVRSETDANGITRSYDAQGNLIYSSDPSEASQITNNGTTAGEQTKVSDYTDARLAELENANLAARQNMNSLLQKYTDPNSSYMQPFNLDKQIAKFDELLADASDSFGTHNLVDMSPDYESALQRINEAKTNYGYQQQGVDRAVNNYNSQNAVLSGLLESQLPIYNMANEQYARAISQGVPESDWEYRKQVQDALMDYQESRLNPTYAKQADALATKLANQGIEQGGNTYGQEWDIYNRAKNDAYQSAYNNAITLGEDAIAGQFNRDMARYQQIAQDYMNTSTQALQAGKNWSDALNSAMNPINSAYSNVNSAMDLINNAQGNYHNVFLGDIDNYAKGEEAYAENLKAQAALVSAQASAAASARQQQQSEIAGLLSSVSPNNNTGTSVSGTYTGGSTSSSKSSTPSTSGIVMTGTPGQPGSSLGSLHWS